jgi:hypothetical protein
MGSKEYKSNLASLYTNDTCELENYHTYLL